MCFLGMDLDIEMMEFDRMRLGGLKSDDYSDACDLYNRFGSRMQAIGIDSCEFKGDLRFEDFDTVKRGEMIGLLNEFLELGKERKSYLYRHTEFEDFMINRISDRFGTIRLFNGLVTRHTSFRMDVVRKTFTFYTNKKYGRLLDSVGEFLSEFSDGQYPRGVDVSIVVSKYAEEFKDEFNDIRSKDVRDWSDRDIVVVWHSLVYALMELDRQIEVYFRSMYYSHYDPFKDQLMKLYSLLYDLNYSYTAYRDSSSPYSNSRYVLKSDSRLFSTFLYDWYRKLERLIDQAGAQGIVMDSRFSEKISVRELMGRGN